MSDNISITVESPKVENISEELKTPKPVEEKFSPVDTETFKKNFAKKIAKFCLCWKNGDGLEISSFRRTKLLKNFLNVNL